MAGPGAAGGDRPARPRPGADAAPRDWDDALDQTRARIEAAGGAGAPVIGYSLGARLALGLWARGDVPAAVLVSVNPGLDDALRAARRADDAAWAALLRDQGTAAFVARWEAQPLFASQRDADPAEVARRRAARAGLDARGLAGCLEAMGLAAMPDYRDRLSAAPSTVHLLVGDRDAKFRALGEALAAAAPGLRVEVVAGSGHDPTLDAPVPTAAALARALARVAA
ncbi:MAG: alpha/beta fold hydrolase [Kofleriaceae bacterium]|nr:alpha/beta fold hydrolase [Kofleriaceae bacterium]